MSSDVVGSAKHESDPMANAQISVNPVSYVGLYRITKANSCLRRKVAETIKSDDFMNNWLQKQSASEEVNDCYSGIGKLIEMSFGSSPEGVETLKDYLKKGFDNSKNYGGVGVMIAAYLANQNDPIKLRELVSNIFAVVWNLDGANFTGTLIHLTSVMEKMDDRDHSPFRNIELSHFIAFDSDAFTFNRTLHSLLLNSTSELARSYFLSELFNKAHRVLESRLERIAKFLLLLLVPLTKGGNMLEIDFYRTLRVRSTADAAKLTPIAHLFKSLTETARNEREVDLVAKVFYDFLYSPGFGQETSISTLLAREPSLVRLFLHEQPLWPEMSSSMANTLMNTIVILTRFEKGNSYTELQNALEHVKKNILRYDGGEKDLLKIVKGLREEIEANREEMEENEICTNLIRSKFFTVFPKVLLRKD